LTAAGAALDSIKKTKGIRVFFLQSADPTILRITTYHENALSPLGERVARDGVLTSRRGSGEGVLVRYFQGREESRQFPVVDRLTNNYRDPSLRSG